jgi:hypothetical protein
MIRLRFSFVARVLAVVLPVLVVASYLLRH